MPLETGKARQSCDPQSQETCQRGSPLPSRGARGGRRLPPVVTLHPSAEGPVLSQDTTTPGPQRPTGKGKPPCKASPASRFWRHWPPPPPWHKRTNRWTLAPSPSPPRPRRWACRKTGATVDVVTDETLESQRDLSLADLWPGCPVSLSRSGGLGTSTSLAAARPARVLYRRADRRHRRVRPLGHPDAVRLRLHPDRRPVADRGAARLAQSALFGSEAIAGVVDITSFRATEEGTEAQVGIEAGSYGTASASAAVGLLSDRTELSFSVSRTTTRRHLGLCLRHRGRCLPRHHPVVLRQLWRHRRRDPGPERLCPRQLFKFDSQTADNLQSVDARLRGLRAFVIAKPAPPRTNCPSPARKTTATTPWASSPPSRATATSWPTRAPGMPRMRCR